MSERKRFDRALFEKYDKAAREATTHYLVSQHYEVMEHPDRYAQDLLFYKAEDFYALDRCMKAECEVKRVWTTDVFPYENVQLPERKKKFCDGMTMFFIWNEPLTHAITFWDSALEDLTPVEVPNKYMYKDEYFFQIPMERVEIVCSSD